MSARSPKGVWEELAIEAKLIIDKLADEIRVANPDLGVSASYFASEASPLRIAVSFSRVIDAERAADLVISCDAFLDQGVMTSDIGTDSGAVHADGPELVLAPDRAEPTSEDVRRFLNDFQDFIERSRELFYARLK